MLKKLLFIVFCCIAITSCKSTKTIQTKANKRASNKNESVVKDIKEETSEITTSNSTEAPPNLLAENLVETAKSYEGTRYKYGGTTKKGMDCSGLVTTVYNSENIKLPRTTGELASSGNWIDLKEVQKGDLLFFATRRNSRTVNHVGIVTDARVGYVEFIHASTSAGVIISSLTEKYWYFAFVQARRIL